MPFPSAPLTREGIAEHPRAVRPLHPPALGPRVRPNALKLWREIKEEGYKAVKLGWLAGTCQAFARAARGTEARTAAARRASGGENDLQSPFPSRRGAWWLVEQTEELDDHQQAFVERLCRWCPEAARVQEMALKSSGASSASGKPNRWMLGSMLC